MTFLNNLTLSQNTLNVEKNLENTQEDQKHEVNKTNLKYKLTMILVLVLTKTSTLNSAVFEPKTNLRKTAND